MRNRIALVVLAGLFAARIASAEDETEGKKIEVDGDTAAVVGTTKGNKLRIEGVGKKLTHACVAKQEIDVEGTNHKITLTGECDHVKVDGTSNVVIIAAARKIVVNGMNNEVSYERGLNDKPPKITTNGLNNKVTKIEKK